MAYYVISYDLHNQRHYEAVWALLGSWGAVRLLESLWVVSLNNGAGEVRAAIEKAIDSDDSIVVIELKPGSSWASVRARQSGVNWLSNNIQNYG